MATARVSRFGVVMAVRSTRYTVDSTTKIPFSVNDGNNRPGMTLVIQNPHSENRHLLIGGPDLNLTDKRGYELTAGESRVVTMALRASDVFYALSESGTDHVFTVLEVGA